MQTQEPVLKVAEAEQRPGKNFIAALLFVDVLVEFQNSIRQQDPNILILMRGAISGTGMYGGNLELVSRRENVQVISGTFCGHFKRNPHHPTTNLCLVEILL